MLVELLRPAGAELGRRWLACLLLAPESERRAIVEAVEQRMADLYLRDNQKQQAGERQVTIAHEPTQADGFIEQKFTTYAVKPAED
ncbi:MAG: hypothetical protein RIB58_03130 [Phycisphaerales bacterium]